MSSTEGPPQVPPQERRPRRLAAWASLAGLGLIAACSPEPAPVAAPASPPASPGAATAAASAAVEPVPTAGRAPSRPGSPSADPPQRAALPPPTGNPRTWAEYRTRAAHRLVAASPGRSYLGPVHEPLLGIPVLQIELNADGSVRTIVVLRHARSARDTTRLAEEAVHRAAPFGAVTHLPKPWRYTETFLFDDERRFKPRTLDE